MNNQIEPSLEIRKFQILLKSETENILNEIFNSVMEESYRDCLEREVIDYLGKGWNEHQHKEKEVS